MVRVEAELFVARGSKTPIVDVRSPAEFHKGHIPGAVNMPIFNNLERARVGTVYKQQSRDEAISLGLEIVGPKMRLFTESARKIAKEGELNVYCWRGGMRSEKMAWLFELVGIRVNVLSGGYKSYRKFLHSRFKKINNLLVIQGPTGSGKTKILRALMAAGEQVIDLEGLANHKGSAFGGLGQPAQPTTQQFQNDILAELLNYDATSPIWIESESITIGRVYLPETLWQKMNEARVFMLDVPRQHRIEHIVEQYGLFSTEALVAKVGQLQQNLGGAKIKEVIEFVELGNLPEAVDLLLNYYDKTYAHSADKYKQGKVVNVSLESADAQVNARILMNCLPELLSSSVIN
jgi:tRNA 2-selenouridine synthase